MISAGSVIGFRSWLEAHPAPLELIANAARVVTTGGKDRIISRRSCGKLIRR
jgi:hypothetical protein